MAEAIIFTVAAEILKKLGSTSLQQLNFAVGVTNELKKLETTLSTINAVLLDAEQKQTTSHQLRLWLQQLEDVLYDAHNILDAFEFKAIQQHLASRDNSKSKVRHIFTSVKFRFGMGYKIKQLREELDQIASNRSQFHLTQGVVDWHVMPREITHSFVDASDVVGRDTDKINIANLLTCSHIHQNLSVVPIVGIGGLGKTTIAKLVYDDSGVNECFQLKMWVCVSNDFNLQKLTKDIYRSATKGDDYDVWNENHQEWNELRQLLINGMKGSKIIVTTRSLQVASIMGTTEPYILEGLLDKDCWSLFAKCAFREGEGKNYPTLEIIGKRIINKCKGVPLALRSLASMLFMKTDERDWLSMEKNEVWRLNENENGILPVLRLSYYQLPSHLKRCFAFCSIFPKDFEFRSGELIGMWMSQGLLQSSVENKELGEMGLGYIKEICSRCFFQDIRDMGYAMEFKMHDLVHDLALLVTKNECYTIDRDPMPSAMPNKIRHMSICTTKDVVLRSIEFDLSNLWTFYYFPNSSYEGANELLVRACIPKFKCLRMLDMKNSSFEVLPESISSLRHLRYLNISYNRNMKKLPDVICKLLHLQTFDLLGCIQLQELPRDIGNLINLRTLRVRAKEIYLVRNKQIGLLTNLRHLQIERCDNLVTYFPSDDMECRLLFPHLQSLSISYCHNVECWPGIMKHLPALEELNIGYCEKLNLMFTGIMKQLPTLEDLMFPSLRGLCLSGLPQLEALPGWIEECSNTLHKLHILFCPNITSWIWNLTSLHQLMFEGCYQILEMPDEISHLTSLRKLIIIGCPALSKRCKSGEGEDWHKIKHIPYISTDFKWIRRRNEEEEEEVLDSDTDN